MDRRGKIISSWWMNKKIIAAVTAVVLITLLPYGGFKAYAGSVNTASDTLSTIEQSVVANHTIQFTLNASDTFSSGENITVTFPTGFDLTSLVSPGDFDFKNAATDETVQSGACAGTDTIRAEVASQTVTFTACSSYTAESAGSTIIIKIGTNAVFATGTGANQIINQSAAQNNSDAKIVIGGTEASGQIAVEIVADNTVLVNATVNASITCAFTGLTTTFSGLDTGSVSTSDTSTTVTISTNGNGGFGLTVRDAGNTTNPGLYKSTATTYLIGSADSSYGNTATLAAGTDGFGIQGSTSGGSGASVTIAARYDQTSNAVGGLELTDTTLASATGAVANRVVTVVHKAAVSGLAPAGAYTDTLTYVCTGVY